MKTLYTTFYFLLIAAICAVGLLVLSSMMPVPGKISIKVVKSGSMEPSIRTGSVVVDRPFVSYGIGDVVTFGADTKAQVPTTHRIVAVTGEGSARTFTVKGDANNAPDPTIVRMSDIHGKVVFTIPYLGYVLAFAKTRLGFFLLVGIPSLFVCFEEVYKIYLEVRRMRRPKIVRRLRPGSSTIGSMRSGPVMDLRRERRSYVESSYARRMRIDGILRVSQRGRRASYAGRSIGMASLLVTVVGISMVLRPSGYTVAYYSSSQVAAGNSLTAASSFPVDTPPPPLQLTSLFTTGAAEVVDTNTPDTPPVAEIPDSSGDGSQGDAEGPQGDIPSGGTILTESPYQPEMTPPEPIVEEGSSPIE